MDLFARYVQPFSGHLRLRIPFQDSGFVTFTLDERDSGQRVVWYACWANLALEGARSVEGNVQQLVEWGVDIVTTQVPSASDVRLDVTIDRSGDTPEIVCVGAVTFLASEWDAAKNSASLGEMFAPRGQMFAPRNASLASAAAAS